MTYKSRLYKTVVSILILLFTVLLGAASAYMNSKEKDNVNSEILGTENGSYKVLDVIDGDTIEIEYQGNKEKVRLLGIDTPETKKPGTPIECFGKEATEKTKELLEGKEVRIEFDGSQGLRDRYGRLLLYVWRTEDNLFINEYLVTEGYAHEYTYDLPYKYQDQFKQQEKLARGNSKGLWGDICN